MVNELCKDGKKFDEKWQAVLADEKIKSFSEPFIAAYQNQKVHRATCPICNKIEPETELTESEKLRGRIADLEVELREMRNQKGQDSDNGSQNN